MGFKTLVIEVLRKLLRRRSTRKVLYFRPLILVVFRRIHGTCHILYLFESLSRGSWGR
jgi:hypothetical protein